MNDRNVHHTEPTSRDDLKHTDTIATGSDSALDPAGYEQSLSPVGEVPPAADGADLPAGEDGPIGARVGHDPSNLGDDVPDSGDLVHPAPMNDPVGKAPGM